jgi:hypothetical protein
MAFAHRSFFSDLGPEIRSQFPNTTNQEYNF